MDEEDINEMYLIVKTASDAGFGRVWIDPKHVMLLIEEFYKTKQGLDNADI